MDIYFYKNKIHRKILHNNNYQKVQMANKKSF